MGGQSGGGNRQDNRQRGNAAQLLEKYKSMARDAQLAGDRVQSEYYLQFADHYFRILSESRARFDEQRRQRGDDMDDDDGDDDGADMSDDSREGDNDSDGESGEREERYERRERRERPERSDRGDRGDRQRRYARDDDRNGAEPRGNGAVESIALDALPPAIGIEEASEAEEAPEAVADRPRRRTRRPRPQDGEGEIAPAA